MTVVFKIGGSLLNLLELATRIRSVLEQRADQDCLLIVGGGAAADVVRDWSQVHTLSDETAHCLAVSSMGLNRELLEGMLDLRSVSSREAANSAWAEQHSPLLLDVKTFARLEEVESGSALPHTWSVTSDSLAAWVAVRWPASELVFVKSVPCPSDLTASQACELQLVDEYFPMLSKDVPLVSWCNLRSHQMTIEPWL